MDGYNRLESRTVKSSHEFRIHCLDGLRAISVGLVLYDHLILKSNFVPSSVKHALKYILPFTGTTGVCCFFVISGFLITTLLLREQEQNGSISLGRFYLRRSIRIFPAFYAYLGIVCCLQFWVDGSFRQWKSFVISGLYLQNFFGGTNHLVRHTWSLSVEEQYYLVWPLMLVLISRKWILSVMIFAIFGWPILRLARHGFGVLCDPRYALEVAAMDTILYGALLALIAYDPSIGPVLRRYGQKPWLAWLGASLLFLIYSFYMLAAGALASILTIVRNICIVSIVWWCINNPHTFVGRLLETRLMVHLGIVSYSLYLWQQPFYGATGIRVGSIWWLSLLLNFLGALTAAHLSFFFLEKPLLALRRRLK